MAITSFTGFVAALGELEISGIKAANRLNGPQASIKGLPCQWVQLPEATEPALTFQANGGWPEFRAQLIVAYEAVAQDNQGRNWSGTLAMLDNVLTALRGAAPNTIGRGTVTWTIRPGIVTAAGTDYWAVIAEVTGHG